VVADPTKQWNPAVAAGTIMKQSVPKGHRAERGDTVTVIVSAGRHTATVPALAPNESFDDYSAALKAAGFQIVQPVTRAYSETVPPNGVISADPEPGKVVDYGKAVIVTISQGRQPIPIPDVTGKPADQAEKQLSDLGFQVTTSSDFSDTVKKGDVISQSKTGSGFKGDAITLDVSKGQELFKVPDVTSNLGNPMSWTSVEQAKKTLQDAGFQVKVGSTGRFGIVTHQDPKGGSMRPKGTLVTIDAS
jgi:serine/threonine-protein kinase